MGGFALLIHWFICTFARFLELHIQNMQVQQVQSIAGSHFRTSHVKRIRRKMSNPQHTKAEMAKCPNQIKTSRTI